MASSLVRELLNAGIHLGQPCSRWNPKMRRYIYGQRNQNHIIDIRQTLRGLLQAKKFLTRAVAAGGDVLFVGTKRQAREIVQRQAERCGMHYVTERWLGGTLTNFRTIRSRLQRLEELEAIRDSPLWETDYSKKIKSTLTRELRKIRRNLGGLRKMDRLPAALVVIDVRKEHNALREAGALNVPRICLIDTDGDPDQADIAIPGNDDGMRAIELIVRMLADAVEEGKLARPVPVEEVEEAKPARPVPAAGHSARESSGEPRIVGRAPQGTVASDQHHVCDVLDPDFVMVWDPAAMSTADYAELVSLLGDLARSNGIVGVERIDAEGYGVPTMEGALA